MQKKEYNHYHLSSRGGGEADRWAAVQDLAQLDLVYPVRFVGGMFDGDELKYSLRSVAKNLPHRKVFVIADHKPMWMNTDVRMLPVKDRFRNRFQNVNKKLLEVCNNDAISDPFILMNDDFFAVQPIESIPYYKYGTLKEHYDELDRRYKSKYMSHIKCAIHDLKEKGLATDDFEIHAPIILDKKTLKQILLASPMSACRRSLYCNTVKAKGVLVDDFKVYSDDDNFPKDTPFLSSHDANFANGAVGKHIKEMFPEPSHYEKRYHR